MRRLLVTLLLLWILQVGLLSPVGVWAQAVAPDAARRAADQPVSSIPRASTHFLGREIADTMHYTGAEWLTRESRQREEDCRQLLHALGVQPGQTVCDLGCGNGFYSLPLARLVGQTGKVYAVDIQPEMLAMLKRRAKQSKIGNIVAVRGTVTDPRLPRGKFDLILMVDVYHELSHPEEMMRQVRAALRPGGRIALAEFRAEDPKVPIKPLHKMSKKQILKEFTAHGLKLVEEYDKLPWQHLMFFEKLGQENERTRR